MSYSLLTNWHSKSDDF